MLARQMRCLSTTCARRDAAALATASGTVSPTPSQRLLTLRELDRLLTSVAGSYGLPKLRSQLTSRFVEPECRTSLPVGHASSSHPMALVELAQLGLFVKAVGSAHVGEGARRYATAKAHERELHFV